MRHIQPGLKTNVLTTVEQPTNNFHQERFELFLAPFTTPKYRQDTSYTTNAWGVQVTRAVDPTGINLASSQSFDTSGNLLTNIQDQGAWQIYQYDASNRVEAVYSAYANQGPTLNR